MIKVNTRDIVNRAQQLADLENSDFISWNENINLLNEAYSKLYQKLINHGDKAFLKTVTVNKEGGLPSDFYQLYSVKTLSGEPILRKGKTEDSNAMRYELRNGQIELCGNLDAVEVAYWPAPETLTLKAEDRPIDTDGEILCANNTKYVVKKQDECAIHDLANGTVKSIEIEPECLGIKSMANSGGDVFSLVNDTSVTYSGEYQSANKTDGIVYIWVRNPGRYQCCTVNGSALTTVLTISSDWDRYRLIPTDRSLTFCYAIDPYGNIRVLDVLAGTVSDIIYTGLINADKAEVRAGSLWYETVEGLKCGNSLIIESNTYYEYVSLMKVDGSTGYGAIVKDTDGNYVVRSVFQDTRLDFPESFYFQYMAYLMAVAYKIKQNADITGLSQMMLDAEEQFYDTLGNDSNEPIRIQNVYGR